MHRHGRHHPYTSQSGSRPPVERSAEARDASLGHKALGQKATALLDQIIGDRYHANQVQHDAEVPETNDPELLERAKQATSFVNGSGSNPFRAPLKT